MRSTGRLSVPSPVVAVLASVLIGWPAKAPAEPAREPPPVTEPVPPELPPAPEPGRVGVPPAPPPAEEAPPIVEPLEPLPMEEPASAEAPPQQTTEEDAGYVSAPPELEEPDKKTRVRPEVSEPPQRVRNLTQAGSVTAILGVLVFGLAAWMTALDDQRRLGCYERRKYYTARSLAQCDPGITAPRFVSRGLYLGSVGLLAGSGSLWGKRAAEGRMAYGWEAPKKVAMGAAGGTLLGIGLVGWAVSRVVLFVSPLRDACATDGFVECTRRNMYISDISRGGSVALAGIGAAMLGYVVGYRAWMRRGTPKARTTFLGPALGHSSLGLVASGRF